MTHLLVGTLIRCGRVHTADVTKDPTKVECKACLRGMDPREPGRRPIFAPSVSNEGVRDGTFRGRGVLRCHKCGQPFSIHPPAHCPFPPLRLVS